MISRRRFLLVSAAFAAFPAVPVAAASWDGIALGARARITLRGPSERAETALSAARRAIAEAEHLFSLYDPSSVLSRLNEIGSATVPDRFGTLLDACAGLHQATDGKFDPTLQPLWQALAKGGDVDRAKALVGWDRIRRDREGRVTLGEGQALTLNGIAQGFATDMVSHALAAHGFSEALVNIGEFRGLGGPWRIGVEDPKHGLLATRTLQSGAIATSSPGALSLSASRQHILDPVSESIGRVSAPLWSTVSVEARTAALADGASTALCHMDVAAMRKVRARLPDIGRVTLIDHQGDLISV